MQHIVWNNAMTGSKLFFSFVIFQIPANILLVKNCSAGKFKISVHFLSEASQQAGILNP